MQLVRLCNEIAYELPDHERYGLASQIRRASVSIPSNIAEGSGRGSDKEFARFIGIAYGSALELETQLQIVESLALAAPTDVKRARGETIGVRRQLAALRATVTP